jgi:hypothetical protein
MIDNTNIDNMKTNTTDVNDDDKLKSEYELNEEDLVFYNKDNTKDQVYGGGFSLNKAVMKAGVSPLQFVGGSAFGEPTTPNISSSYALPTWAYSNGGYKKGIEEDRKDHMYKTETLENEDEYVSDDLHDRLLSLVSTEQKKNDTISTVNSSTPSKRSKITIKKTKKNKKVSKIQGSKKGIRHTKKRSN